MKEDDTWAEGLIGMQTDFVYFIPQSHKIRKGGGFVLRLPEQGSGVEGTHEPHAVLLHKGAVLLGHGEIGGKRPAGRLLNTLGRVMKISAGPLLTSTP